MADAKIIHLIVDTSYLRGVGFRHPDFQKLVLLSKNKKVRIFIPHIVWEEWRNQLEENIYTNARKIREGAEALKIPSLGGLAIDGLAPPNVSVWPNSEIDVESKAAMTRFAKENNIKIIPLAADHADRAWARYFKADPPFDREDRKNRRDHIPDSWIFETAIDLRKEHVGLVALCNDGRLSKALELIGIKTFKETRKILDLINETTAPEPAKKTVEITVAATVLAEATAVGPEKELDAVLGSEHERFKSLEAKILGYVGYLGSPSKDQLFDLLSQSGISTEIAHNVAERLAIKGLITDTGNHYLPANKTAGALAAKLIESEIIKLLDS